jgi:uncharacterized membrane protein YeaQ/YmgE (transglycosylase-associated protein family)
MQTLVWIVAGALVGWMSYALLRFNTERGVVMSMVIGVVGALIGAKAIAPMFLTAATPPGEVTLPLVVFAAGAAVALAAAADLLNRRFGV